MSIRHFRIVASAVAFALVAAASPVRADEATNPVDSDAGIGIAAGLATLVYTPAKVIYALGGGVAAGMAYIASAGNQDVTEPILTPSLRGDYIVTPEHLRGEKELEFFGREPNASQRASAETPPVSSGDGLDAAPADETPAADAPAESDATD